MAQWEHFTFVVTDKDLSARTLDQKFNQLGLQEWELVNVVTQSSRGKAHMGGAISMGNNTFLAFFKRVKPHP